jgi:hypothetical protein
VAQAAAIAEHRDVGGDVAVDHEDVGGGTGGDDADRVERAPQGDGPVARGARDRLQRREAEDLHQHLQLPGVPVAVGGEREPALRAAQDRDAGVVGRAELVGGGLDLAPEHVDLGGGCSHLLPVVGQVGQEGEGRRHRTAGRDHGLHGRLVEVAGVQDQVDAGLGGEAGRLGAAAVRDGRGVEGVGRLGDGSQLVGRPHRQFTSAVGERAGDVDLDPVGAVLDLLAGGPHHLVAVAHDLGVARSTGVGDEAPGRPAGGGEERVQPGRHARALDQPGLDGIAQGRTDVVDAVGVEEARHPGEQQLLHVERGEQGGARLGAVEEQLVVAGRLAEGDVTVGVDEPGEHRQPGDVVHHRVGPGLLAGGGPHGHDPVDLQEHVGAHRGRAATVDHGPTGEQGR